MVTRLQLQSETKLSRKALRIYEERGLLVPTPNSKHQAVYHPDDVETAGLIKALRSAGITIEQILGLLKPGSSSLVDNEEAVKTALKAAANNAFQALEKLQAFSARREIQVQKIRHGGCWTLEQEATLQKSRVADFVSEFIRSIRSAGADISEIGALYEDEKEETVKVTCFKKEDDGNIIAPEMKRNFLPEGFYYSIKSIGVSGAYSCFDRCYEKMLEVRQHDSVKIQPSKSIEIYRNYPHDKPYGQNFEAQLLI